MRSGVLLALALAALLCAGCGGAGSGLAQSVPSATPLLLPVFPIAGGQAALATAVRGASATNFVLTGSQAWQQSPQGDSYIPAAQPAALVLSPAEGSAGTGSSALKTAWAVYRFDGMLDERPVSLVTDVAAAGATDGAPPLPLNYYVGVSDHSLGRWQWQGPFASDATVQLNSAELRQRMVDGAGSFFVCLAADARAMAVTPQNPQGRVAVQVSSVTVSGSVTAADTKPLLLKPSAMRIGSSMRRGSKLTSTLQPSQFPVVEWSIPAEPAPHLGSAPSTVLVYRRGPSNAQPLLVAQLGAQAQLFRDPLDLNAGVPSAKGGSTYVYSLQAANAAGFAGLGSAPPITVPILPPQQLQATQDSPGGTSTLVSWQASDGAAGYHVLRGLTADGSGAAELAEVAAPALTSADLTAVPGQLYWYFVWAEGAGDGDAANGFEAGSLSENSSPAQGLRGVVLSLGTSAPGAGTAASPFLLTPAQSYQFQVADQQGTPRTNICSYTVQPASAASFAGTAGLLTNIQPAAGDFSVTATLSYQEFVWTAQAACRAQ
jgi:hypothetical protein